MRGGPTALPFPTCSCLCPPCSCQVLDVDMAIAGHRMVGDASMVLSLERIRQYEDKNLLAAHIMVLLERDYNQAQVGSEGGGGGSRACCCCCWGGTANRHRQCVHAPPVVALGSSPSSLWNWVGLHAQHHPP